LEFTHADGTPYGGAVAPAVAHARAKAFRALAGMGFAKATPSALSHEFHTPSPPSSRSFAKRFASSPLSNGKPYRSGIGAVVGNGPRCRLPRAPSPDAEHHAA